MPSTPDDEIVNSSFPYISTAENIVTNHETPGFNTPESEAVIISPATPIAGILQSTTGASPTGGHAVHARAGGGNSGSKRPVNGSIGWHVGRRRAKRDFKQENMTELAVQNGQFMAEDMSKPVHVLEEKTQYRRFQCLST